MNQAGRGSTSLVSNLENELELYQGVFTLTTVGLGKPAVPLYATVPRYLVLAAKPLKDKVMEPEP